MDAVKLVDVEKGLIEGWAGHGSAGRGPVRLGGARRGVARQRGPGGKPPGPLSAIILNHGCSVVKRPSTAHQLAVLVLLFALFVAMAIATRWPQ